MILCYRPLPCPQEPPKKLTYPPTLGFCVEVSENEGQEDGPYEFDGPLTRFRVLGFRVEGLGA